jgi:tetratricopeptide (TPR) repeat protein
MASPEENMYQEAMAAVQAGDSARARDLFTRLLKLNQNNADYWLWMSAMVETARERNYCLGEVLRRDPANAAARRGLQIAGQAAPDASQVLPQRFQRRNWEAAFFGSENPQGAMAARNLRLTLGVAGALVLVLIVIVAGIWTARRPKYGVVYSTQDVSFHPSATYLPTASPVVRSPTPTFTGPTPLWMQMQETYTPTPLYVGTPHPQSEAYRIGIRAYGRSDWPGLEKYMQQVITVQPDSPDVFYYMGEANRFQEKYPAALGYYNQAIGLNPDFAPAYLGRARVRLAMDPTAREQPLADLQLALQNDPDLAEANLELARLDIADRHYEEALLQLDLAAKTLPASPLEALYRGTVYLKMDKPQEALEQAQRANSLDFTLLPAYRLLGEAFLANQQGRDALKPLKVYTTYVSDDGSAYVLLAQAYDAQEDLEGALAAYQRALTLDPRLIEIYRSRAELFVRRKMYDQAVSDFQKALRFDKTNYAVLLELGQVYFQQEIFRNAYVQFETAFGVAQEGREKAEALYWRARSLEAIDEINAAVKDYKSLATLESGTAEPEWISFAATKLVSLATFTPLPRPTDTRVPTKTATVPSPTLTPSRTPTQTQTATFTRTVTSTRTATRLASTTPKP